MVLYRNIKPMETIIVGKQGEQRFPITQDGVSRQHARVIIDGGHWIIEDLDSTNGTFVRDADGFFHRISRVEISEDTVIRLGDESSNGYSFMAHHLLETDPNDYGYEFAFLARLRDSLKAERERCQAAQRRRGLVQIGISLAVIILSFIPPISEEHTLQLMVLRVGMLLPPIYSYIVSGKNKMQKIIERQQRLIVCPRCGRPLTDYEITKQACMSCKAHS